MGLCFATTNSIRTLCNKDYTCSCSGTTKVHGCAGSPNFGSGKERKDVANYQFNISDHRVAGTDPTVCCPDGQNVETGVQKVIREHVEKIKACVADTNVNQHLTNVNDAVEKILRGPYGLLVAAYPSLLFSNRTAVVRTGGFVSGENVEKYRVVEPLPLGTVGRSFSVVRELGTSLGGGSCIFKVVNFALRMDYVKGVLKDQRILTNLNHKNVLRCLDVLDDDLHENMIFVTPFVENGSVKQFAGKLLNDIDKLKGILYDIGVGIRVLHSHELYHNNLKLENILISTSNACIADAGFWRLFASQSPESLVFNGELACMPPEVFTSVNGSQVDPSKVDIWGFGILMYRIVYGCNPFNIEGRSFDEVRNMILCREISIPSKSWSYGGEFQELFNLCLNPDPNERPTIITLLRHSFFRSCVVRNLSTANQSLGISCGNVPVIGRSFTIKDLNRTMSSMSVVPGSSRVHLRHGFTVESVLGKGRQCETILVYLRRDPTKLFTLKVMKSSVIQKMLSRPKDADKIRNALALCLAVSHPNLLPLLEIVEDKDGCFATQDFVGGDSLETRFPSLVDNELPDSSLKHMLLDCIRGLHFLHKNGLAHLSLTLTNIFYKRGKGYILTDFGPLFCTKEHVLQGENGTPWYKIPPWVLDDLRSCTSFGASVDTFCLGLIAASVVPVILQGVWSTFRNSGKGKELNVEKIIKEVSKTSNKLPEPLVHFIKQTLTTPVSVEDLLKHRYFEDIVDKKDLSPIIPMSFTKEELQNCVHDKFHCRDESRLLDVLGQDPMENVMMASVFTDSNIIDADIEMEVSVSNTNLESSTVTTTVLNGDPDRIVRLPFENKIACGLCHVELSIVLFKCSKCENYVRCGKCSVSDEHGEAHVLVPYLIHMIEHNKNGKHAVLIPPSSIQNTQALEELEMQANLPVGALTKSFSFERANVNVPAPLNGISEGGVSRTCLKQQALKSKKLPKASEVDDSSWEEEVRNCRERRSAELLLYRFDLTAVPKELFDPPLTHVMHLDLSYNKLSALPHELSFLVSLRRFVVANNQIVELPVSFGNLSELEHLDVSHNRLRDLPSSFTFLHRLGTIAMDYNDFSDIPESILDLVACTASEPVLSAIYMAENPRIIQFPKLESLSLFPSLKLALDNEPTVYATYLREKLDEKLPNVNILWNKIYPDCIVKNLYCGSLRSAQSQVIYEKLNIRNLLTMGRDLLPTPPIGGKHQTITVDDIDGADILHTFSDAVDFIDEALKRNEGCLVHCFAGMSRSATTVIAFLMIKQGMRLDEAYCITKRGRPAIYPNHGFFKQLVSLDAKLFPKGRPLDMASMEREKVPMA